MLDDLWDRILIALDGRVPASALESWIQPCRLIAFNGDTLRVAAPNKSTRDWLTLNHAEALDMAARDVLGGNPRVSIEIDRDAPPAALPLRPHRDGAALEHVTGLAARYTFDTFVVGNSNQFAQAACQAVADLPSKAYNPLFLYGGVGLGKTHLLHAVGHQINRLYPSLRLLYLSTERFTNDLINAIRYDRTAEFRAKYRSIDLLLIDDIQFISGKERTQEEFFHTFNDLYEAHKQIVVSSDSAPKEIPDIEERLRSRFEWGLIADIQPPDFETRVAILRKKAELERVRLPDEVAYLIASRIKSNIREIEGSLTRIIAYCSLSGGEMTVDVAQDVLSELWGDDEKVITIDHIQRKTADFFGVRISDMRAKNRARGIAFPRQIAMYLARQLTHASLAEVGRAFGGKDHTTVIHAVDKVQNLILEDPKFKKTLDTLTQSITL
jgi:chromosomal replication initiator protein